MSAILKLFDKGKTIQFKKNEFFLTPKKEPKGIYQVTKGFIFSYSQSSSHKKRIQMILKEGDIFPIAWTIHNTTRKNIYIQALTEGSVQMIEKKVFLGYIQSNHEASLEIISMLLDYLNIYADRVDNLEYNTVREKLINRILFFAGRFGTKKGKAVLIELPITHKLIAESISVSRENVTRELKSLEKKNLLFFKNHKIIISDINMLHNELIH